MQERSGFSYSTQLKDERELAEFWAGMPPSMKGLLLYLLVLPRFWRCEVSGQAGFSADKCIQFLTCLPKDCMQGMYFHILPNWSKKHFISTRDHYSGFTAIRPSQVVHDTCYDGLRDIQNVAK